MKKKPLNECLNRQLFYFKVYFLTKNLLSANFGWSGSFGKQFSSLKFLQVFFEIIVFISFLHAFTFDEPENENFVLFKIKNLKFDFKIFISITYNICDILCVSTN